MIKLARGKSDKGKDNKKYGKLKKALNKLHICHILSNKPTELDKFYWPVRLSIDAKRALGMGWAHTCLLKNYWKIGSCTNRKIIWHIKKYEILKGILLRKVLTDWFKFKFGALNLHVITFKFDLTVGTFLSTRVKFPLILPSYLQTVFILNLQQHRKFSFKCAQGLTSNWWSRKNFHFFLL